MALRDSRNRFPGIQPGVDDARDICIWNAGQMVRPSNERLRKNLNSELSNMGVVYDTRLFGENLNSLLSDLGKVYDTILLGEDFNGFLGNLGIVCDAILL